MASSGAILRGEKREISILVASEEVTITHACYAAGEQVAGPPERNPDPRRGCAPPQ